MPKRQDDARGADSCARGHSQGQASIEKDEVRGERPGVAWTIRGLEMVHAFVPRKL
jgi:hypothetical protein